MPANTNPIFTKTPNVGRVSIPTTNALAASNGASAGTGTSMMYKVFTAGADGSFIERIRFFTVASAAGVTGVATTLRAFLSTVANPGATTASDTFLIGEVSAAAQSSSNSTNATNYVDMVLNMPIPAGTFIHVAQHVAQTTNQNWNAVSIGGDY